MRRTKLVCTLGPASVERVRDLVEAGMNIARINFSHGTDAEHARAFEAVRRAADEAERAVGILADLSGPKVRLGELEGGQVDLEAGARFVLRAAGGPGDASGAPCDHPGLARDLRPGDRVLLADGAAELRVVDCGGDVVTEVVRGGTIRSRAGLNVPSERLSLPAVSEKDRADLARAVELGADFVAQSFVRRAEDVRELRHLIGDRPVQVMAKVETRAAVDDADEILKEADAVMLARGDLGVEMSFEEIPIVQKNLVRQAISLGVPVVVATQMLESMTAAPRPTRAEASDVANAVLDGADAILLSAETAIGHYPIEAARAAARIAEAAEREGTGFFVDRRQRSTESEAQAIAQAAWTLAQGREVEAIVCFTRTGRMASLLSMVRPRLPVLAFSPDPRVVRLLTIRHAVIPFLLTGPYEETDAMIASMDRQIRASRLLPDGCLVSMVASTPVGEGHTNLLKLHRVGS